MLCDDVICFRPTKNSHSRLHWDCIVFFVECNQSKKPVIFKETPKKSKTPKEATKESKHDVTDGHENEAQSPCKNLQGRPICSPTNLDFSRLRNQIRMRSLVPRERNNVPLYRSILLSFLLYFLWLLKLLTLLGYSSYLGSYLAYVLELLEGLGLL